jgi:hypothetical protein
VHLQRFQVRVPRHARLEAEAERESFLRHYLARLPEHRLVVGPERPEAERRNQPGPVRPVGNHWITLAIASQPDQSFISALILARAQP